MLKKGLQDLLMMQALTPCGMQVVSMSLTVSVGFVAACQSMHTKALSDNGVLSCVYCTCDTNGQQNAIAQLELYPVSQCTHCTKCSEHHGHGMHGWEGQHLKGTCLLASTSVRQMRVHQRVLPSITTRQGYPCVTSGSCLLAGLKGQNQIVGMGDTGIDWLHCTFVDSSTPGPGSGPYIREPANTGGFQSWSSPTHRKIVYYRQVADNVDDNGHGTHCAGSAVGSLQAAAGM